MLPCQVCDYPKSEKAYNSRVCHACRVFFYRYGSIDFRTMLCPSMGNCVITFKQHRMNCPACRLKKCFDANMRRNGNVVNSLHCSNISYPPMKKLTEMYGSIMNTGFKMIENLNNFKSTSEWITCLAHFESQLLSRNGPSVSLTTANTDMSLYDLVMFPGACIDRSTKAIDILSDSPITPSRSVDPKIKYKIRETLLRLHVAAIETLSLIDEFHLLPDLDKIRLVQQNALMMPCCIMLYDKYRQGWDAQTCAKYLERYKLDCGPGTTWSNIVATWKCGGLARMDAMEEICLTENEMLLLRIRSYFRPGVNHTEEGHHIIIRTRLKLAAILGEHIREMHPTYSNGEVQHRLRRLLEIEDLIKACANGFHNAYVILTSSGAFGFDAPLIQDIFIRNFK